ncbi:hypothetical protein ACJX0J_041094, partial [Zea mays]
HGDADYPNTIVGGGGGGGGIGKGDKIIGLWLASRWHCLAISDGQQELQVHSNNRIEWQDKTV